MKKITLLLFVIFSSWQISAQVSSYSFSQGSGTYAAITGGTVLGDTASDDQRFVDPALPLGGTTATGVGFPIGFNFTYNGFVYDRFAVNTNGWISFGTSSATPSVNINSSSSYTCLSSTSTAVTNDLVARCAGFARDLQSQAGGDIRYELIGTAPNRVLVVQWTNYKKFGTSGAGDSFNFQIRAYETSNNIEVVYGTMTNNTTSGTAQSGLRANPNTPATNFNSRTTTTNWSASTASVSAANTMTISATVFPASGLTYTWTPPVPCTGTPAPGTVAPTALSLCSGSLPGNLVLSGFSSGVAGLAFQWEQSNDGVAWVNVVGGTGATTATYTPPAYAGTPIQYRAKVTCTNSSLFDFSTPTIISNATNPTVQVTNGTATNLSGISASLNWTNGNGSRRVVVLSDNPTIVDPVNGNAPVLVAAAAYAGSGQQIMYDGTAAAVNVTGLASGATYYVKVYEYLRCGTGPYDYYYNVSSGTNVFSFVSPLPPANDDCGGAIALTVGVNLAANAVVGNNGGATASQVADPTIPAPGCSSYLGGDVWYSVTVPVTGNITIETSNSAGSTINDTGLTVYSGTCGALALVECDDDDSANGLFSLISLTGRTPGEVLYIRVFEYGNNAFGDFQVSAYDCPSATPAPTGSAAQAFCSAAAPTVASLVATGTAIQWYDAATAGNLLASTTALVSGNMYYASQTLTCESFNRLAVTATVTTNPAAPTASASQTFCSAANPTVASLVATGTAIKWYDAATAGNLLASTTALVSGNMYYASQTVSTCESTTRVAVTATINANPAAPTGNASQTYCSTSGNTIANLVVTGTNLVWYDAATLGNVLPTSTVLTSTTYYVASTNGACESPRLAITTTENCPVAGCLNAPNGQWPGATFVPNPALCDGIAVQNVTFSGWAGEYSLVTVTLGQTYIFSSSLATDIVTISADAGATVAAAGTGSVTWVSTLAGNIRFYTHLTGCGAENVSRTRRLVCGVPSTDAPDYVNLQFPATINITQGGSEIVYGQVYEAGLTDVAPNITGQAPGITAWVGISPIGSNTNPDTWTNWIPTTWNASNVGNNDEYQATIGATLLPGTYYYATRFRLNLGPFVYGGYSATGGGFWNTTTNTSGVLTVSPPPPPANDDCSGAIALTVNADLACGTVTPGTVLGATASTVDATACAGTEDDDVWFSFVATATSHTISLLNITGSTTDMYHSVWTGANCNSLTLVPNTCSDPNSSAPSGLVIGTTYYVRVYTWTGTAGQTSAFNICIGTPPPPPANDACAGAVALTVGVNATSNVLSTTNESATLSAQTPIPTCGAFNFATNAKDVWYSVTVPSSGNVTIETDLNGGLTDSVIQVYSGACGALVAVSCDDDGGNGFMSLVNITGQTSGTVLLVRVHGYNGAQGTFTIAAYDCPSATPAPTGSAAQAFCSAAAPTVASLVATGTAIKWYDAATAGNLLASTTALVSGTTYYASQTLTCESFNRLAVTATVTTNPAAPTASASQTFCSAAAPTVASLVATGTAIKWYDASTAGNLLASTTALVSGNIYYASQTVSTCESTTRVAVTATINASPAIPTGNASQTYCSTAGNTIANLVVTGTNLVWYDAATLGNVLPTSTVLTSTTYYVASTNGACQSPRLAINTTEDCPVAGCLTSPNGQWPTATFVPNPALCDGIAVQNVTTVAWAGEYSVVTVTLGQTYIFSSSLATDIVTISADAGATVAAAGTGSVTWVSTLAGNIRFYTHLTGCGDEQVSRTRRLVCGVPSTDAPDYANLQFPATININQGGTSIVYGQVYEAGLTDVAPNITGQAPGITAWVGISPLGSNTNPNTWTNWIPATWNAGNVGNNDEYQATIGAALLPGTYYYATRFRLNLGAFVYGGYSATGGGFWNTTTNISGVLTVAAPPAPANDECSGAIALTVNPDAACGTVTPGTVLGATASTVDATACFGTEDDDVWFSFVATGTSHIISLLNITGSTTDMYHSLWTGADCNSLTLVSGTCSDPNTSTPSGLVIGTTYYVRVYTWTATAGQTSAFNICIGTPPPPPANDDCSGAIALTVNPDVACGTVTPGTVFSATASAVDATACGGTENDDVWFSFVASQTTHRISLLDITGSTTDLYHSLWTGADCNSLTLVPGTCSDPNISNPTGLVIGTTYYVRVYTWTGTAGQTSAFNICIGTPAPPPPAPANDNCSGAVALTPGGTFDSNPLNGTILSATTTAGITPSCQTNFGYDVWYSVVVPASGSLTIETKTATTNSMSDSVISVFTGTCGSLTQFDCDDDDGDGNMSILPLTGLTPGQTIYIAVWKWNITAPSTTDSNFRISAYDSSLSNAGFDSASFTYYPNPVKDILNLSYSQNISQVEVYNLVGQKMTTNAYNENNVQIDMSRYPTGVYLVNVTANNITKTVRVIKE